MLHRLIFSTTDPDQAARLERAAAKLPGILLEHSGPLVTGYSKPEVRKRAKYIYDDYKAGLSGREIAMRYQVSTQTVSRIVLDPARYGIRGKPLRRIRRRTN